jgi:hypothetical protein
LFAQGGAGTAGFSAALEKFTESAAGRLRSEEAERLRGLSGSLKPGASFCMRSRKPSCLLAVASWRLAATAEFEDPGMERYLLPADGDVLEMLLTSEAVEPRRTRLEETFLGAFSLTFSLTASPPG